MALTATIKETKFGVGDVVRVHQTVSDSKGGEEKKRTQVFEGTVIGIKGHGAGKSFTVRRIGTQKVGIEQIYPVMSPIIEKIEVAREGLRGSRHAKLYYTRDKSKREIEKIYTRAVRKTNAKKAASEAKPNNKVAAKKKATSAPKAKKSSKKK